MCTTPPSASPHRNLSLLNILLFSSFTPSLEPLLWARHYSRSWERNIPLYPYLCNKHVFNIYSAPSTEAPPLPALRIFSQAGPSGKEQDIWAPSQSSPVVPKKEKGAIICQCAFNPLRQGSHSWKAAGIEFKPRYVWFPLPSCGLPDAGSA